MGNTIIFALVGLVVVLLIVSFVVWQMGIKKVKIVSDELKTLHDERNTLKGDLAVSQEKCKRIETLDKELSRSQEKQDKLQNEMMKVSSDLAVEVERSKNITDKNKDLQVKNEGLTQEIIKEIEKNKKFEKISSELAALQSRADEDKNTIAELNLRIQEEQRKLGEQTTLLDRIKKLYA